MAELRRRSKISGRGKLVHSLRIPMLFTLLKLLLVWTSDSGDHLCGTLENEVEMTGASDKSRTEER